MKDSCEGCTHNAGTHCWWSGDECERMDIAMPALHIGDTIKTPIGGMTVDDLDNDPLYIYLSGHGFTWSGNPKEFKEQGFSVVKK